MGGFDIPAFIVTSATFILLVSVPISLSKLIRNFLINRKVNEKYAGIVEYVTLIILSFIYLLLIANYAPAFFEIMTTGRLW